MTTFTNEDLARRQDEMHSEIVGMREDFKDFYKANLDGRVSHLEDNWKWLARSLVGVVFSIIVGVVVAFAIHPAPFFGTPAAATTTTIIARQP